VRIWGLDEHRYGLLPVIRRVWARKGVRVHAPYKTTCQWGYLHETLEVNGKHQVELLLTPSISQGTHAVFLSQIAESEPEALHVVVMDQAGFHMKQCDARVPENIRVLRPCRRIARNSTQQSGSDVWSKLQRSTSSTKASGNWRST
jgi:hypothetical protein